MGAEAPETITMQRWLLCALLVCCGIALTTETRADPHRTPINVRGRKLAPLTFSRLVVRLARNEIGVEGDHLRIRLLEELRGNGYRALGAESLVFDRDDSKNARFVLGGPVFELACKDLSRTQRRCGVSVRWELLDRESDQVSYGVVTRHASTGTDPTRIGEDLLWGAFHSLLARPKFVKALAATEAAGSPPSPSFGKATYRACARPNAPMPASSEAALQGTVVVHAGNRLGSGTMISPDGFVLTAAHVVAGGQQIQIEQRAGRKLLAHAVRVDAAADVALLRIHSGRAYACIPVRTDSVAIGDDLFAIGSPLGKALAFSLTRGVVSGLRKMDGIALVQTDAGINRGNSGGPLLDAQGRLVAVVSFKAAGSGVEGIAFGVPTGTALERLALVPGEASEPVLQQAVQAVTPSAAPVDDVPDPVIPLDPPPPPVAVVRPPVPEKPRGPKSPLARSLTTAGLITAGVGAIGVGTTYALYQGGASSLEQGEFDRLRLVNDISWLALAAGVGMFITSQALPRDPVPPRSPKKPSARRRPSLSAGLGPGVVTLGLRY